MNRIPVLSATLALALLPVGGAVALASVDDHGVHPAAPTVTQSSTASRPSPTATPARTARPSDDNAHTVPRSTPPSTPAAVVGDDSSGHGGARPAVRSTSRAPEAHEAAADDSGHHSRAATQPARRTVTRSAARAPEAREDNPHTGVRAPEAGDDSGGHGGRTSGRHGGADDGPGHH
ncbi:MAG: hypothetical protein QOJ32_3383 [Frankiaceae bacterium]|nr:hypothetical protein [Frankiaceae bacterium]